MTIVVYPMGERKNFRDMMPDERRAYMRELVRKDLQEPRTKKMNCSDCGEPLRRLYPERTLRVWCMDCSMKALEC